MNREKSLYTRKWQSFHYKQAEIVCLFFLSGLNSADMFYLNCSPMYGFAEIQFNNFKPYSQLLWGVGRSVFLDNAREWSKWENPAYSRRNRPGNFINSKFRLLRNDTLLISWTEWGKISPGDVHLTHTCAHRRKPHRYAPVNGKLIYHLKGTW